MARKSYVQVYIEGEGYKLVPKSEHRPAYKSAMIMPDITPYKSTIDGSTITSRSKHKAHLRQHGCIEVGNEYISPKKNIKPDREAIRKELYSNFENVSQEGNR